MSFMEQQRLGKLPTTGMPGGLRSYSVGILVCLLGFWAFADHAVGSVTLKDGNYFIGYTDLTYDGDLGPRIDRVYNSKSSFRGIFGWGWGSEYEMNLAVCGDGTALVNEYGGARENVFWPTSSNEQQVKESVALIAAAAQKADSSLSGDSLTNYAQRLQNDHDFRCREWNRFAQSQALPQTLIMVGTQLHSYQLGDELLERVSTGYRRSLGNGRIEEFDLGGKLRRIEYLKSFLTFSYDARGGLEKITDNLGRSIRLGLSADGLVEAATDDHNRTAIYKYDRSGELVYNRDVDGNVYAYQYDSAQRHNLVGIGYSDGTHTAISYYPRSGYENTMSVEDTKGGLTTFTYTVKDPNREYYVDVDVRNAKNKLLSHLSYAFYNSWATAGGFWWTSRVVKTFDGERSDLTYDPRCYLPSRIETSDGITEYSYNDKCQVFHRNAPDVTTDLQYNNDGTLRRIDEIPKANSKRGRWAEYTYSEGRLASAKYSWTNEGKLQVTYDDNKRVATMREGDQTMTFTYDAKSNPTVVSLSNVGTIRVQYAEDGSVLEIDTVKETSTTSDLTSVRSQIVKSFGDWIEPLRPVGLKLSGGLGGNLAPYWNLELIENRCGCLEY